MRVELSWRVFPHYLCPALSQPYSEWMHRIDYAVVQGGQLVLSGLPFQDGQSVRISVVEVNTLNEQARSVVEVRQLLHGGVERFDDPFELMIPADHSEALRS